MNHIFGESDDIAFGSGAGSQKKSEPSPNPPRPQPPRVPAPKPVAHREPRERVSITPPSHPTRDEPRAVVVPLTSLVESMKPSFLPKEEDMNLVRLIAFSGPTQIDPLFLLRQDDTTILIGSGFGSVTRAGKSYPTFPDMRLIVSEMSHLRAWILLDSQIDVSLFQMILPALGFPPLYATRDVIAKFRNNITDQDFLSSCRFFEVFPDGSETRRIGDVECVVQSGSPGPHLAIRAAGSVIGFAHLATTGSGESRSELLLTRSGDQYLLGDTPCTPGEILAISSGKVTKQTMKFTFDTFYQDAQSVGVVAGYTLGDREQLADNGVLVFTLQEDARTHSITGHIFIDSRGFVQSHEMMRVHKEILKGIKSTYEKLLTDNPKIERGELVQGLRREITKYCYILTGRTPVVMPIVIER